MRPLRTNKLTRRTDPRLVTLVVVFLIFLLGVLVFGLAVATPERNLIVWKGLAVALPCLALLLAPAYLSDRGYQVCWDDEGVYARLPGWRFEALTSSQLSPSDELVRDYRRPKRLFGWFTRPPTTYMKFGDILSVGDPAIGARGERPTIYISGHAEPAGLYNNLIGIDLESFTRDSVLDLLEVLRSRRPDLVPQGWAKQLAQRPRT